MKKTIVRDLALLGLTIACLVPVVTMAGDLNPPAGAGPEAAGSAMYSTDAIWNRLEFGEGDADGNAKRSGAFVEPGAGPGNGVGKTLDEIMDKAPAADMDNGATQADVVFGKTYWSLRTGTGSNATDSTWGLNVGRRVAPVASSGQTTSYAAGDDGALHKGVALPIDPDNSPLPIPRFTDNTDGTVTDNLTGLIWLQDANCFGARDWAAALTDAATLNSGECGLSLTEGSAEGDWRLPNQKELSSLVNLQYVTPALSNAAGDQKWTAGDPFLNVQSSYYWSSSTVISELASAWRVDLNSGIVDGDDKTTGSHPVWPVRDGQ